MNNPNYEAIISQVKTGFQENHGKGYCYIYNPANPIPVLFDVIIGMINKRNNMKICIITETYAQRTAIAEAFESTNRKEYLNNIHFLTHAYARSYKSNYDCVIFVGINDDEEVIINCCKNTKFALVVFTKLITNNKFKNAINDNLKEIPVKIDREKLNHSRIYSPVEEYRHPVTLSHEDSELSKKYDNYIKDSIAIFGSLDMIEKCRIGDKNSGKSAIDFKYEVAYHNGWSTELDKSIDFNNQIDDLYNPAALGERVSTIFQITNARKKLLVNNSAKLPIVLDIVARNKDKNILIVSSTGDFCNTIMKYLTDNDFRCTGCHNELEDSYMFDEDGNVVCYKGGEHKGEPKLFKAQALSSNNLINYNAGIYNILCIKSSADPIMETSADIIIFTTTLCPSIFDFRQRFEKIKLNTPTEIHRLYCLNTSEESAIIKEVPSSFVHINENIEINYTIDEKSGEIIL